MKAKHAKRLAELLSQIEGALTEIQSLPLTLDGPEGQGFYFVHNLHKQNQSATVVAIGPELLHNLLLSSAQHNAQVGTAIREAGLRLAFEATRK